MSRRTKWQYFPGSPPPFRYGSGSSDEDKARQAADFEFDEKSGLLVPAHVAKNRRKVPIGFSPPRPP